MALPAASYHPRRPQDSDYYHCVEDYFETFVQEYDDRFARQYGFRRPYLEKVIYRYLDCGDLSHGFARVKLVLDLIGDARTAATNIYWRSRVSAVTSARPVIRSAWWNSGSGSAWMSSKRCRTGISSSASRREIFGSVPLTDDENFTLVLKKDSRSLANIKENPYASF
ncbi:MAG: hypothetical protein WA096_03085 [Smithella sp.]